MKQKKVVTVIIPSIGRDSLVDVIVSIAPDFKWISEVIVVDDSKVGFEENLLKRIESIPNLNLRIIRIANRNGAGYARNAGLDVVNTIWVAFADDDDPWHQNRLEKQMPILENSKLSAAIFTDDKWHTRKEIWDGTTDPLVFLYGERGFFRHKRFLPFGTLIYKREDYKTVRFDAKLVEREDLWFLHTMYQTNNQFRQFPLPGCKVNRNVFRSIRRPAIESDIEWMGRLHKIEMHLAFNFGFYVVFRNAILTLDIRKILTLAKERMNFPKK